MTHLAIRAIHLKKSYRIRTRRDVPLQRTMREDLSELPRYLHDVLRRRSRGHTRQFWALDDVSFDIEQGETVGIIGENGAGKSTLIKILSQIALPTSGRAELFGRVSTLLEVGAGFHPDLTGRENVYLGGAVLGMKRREIARRLDEIVSFAGVGEFLEEPVKHYSSGMYMRLAFAVAAHLESEILLVDEALSVGDAAFQRKCLTKMMEMGKEGRAVLFISHSTQSITRLCPRAILLAHGRVVADGPSAAVVDAYLEPSRDSLEPVRQWSGEQMAPGDQWIRLRSVRVQTSDGCVARSIDVHHSVGIEMVYDVRQSGLVLEPGYEIYAATGACLFVAADMDPEWKDRPRPAGRYASTMWIPSGFLTEGGLTVSATMSSRNPFVMHYAVSDAVSFQVIDARADEVIQLEDARTTGSVIRPVLPWITRVETVYAPR